MHSIPVREIMTSPVVTVTPETLVMDAAELMEEHDIRRLPVVSEDGHLRGMLTDADVIEAETAEYSNSNYGRSDAATWIRVADVMSHDVVTVGRECTVGELAATFVKHRVGGVPVICTTHDSPEGCPHELLGIVTETDIFQLIAGDWQSAQAENIVEAENIVGLCRAMA